MKRLTLTVGDQELSGWVFKKGKALWVHVLGETYLYTPETLIEEEASGQAQDPGFILAPMPGKIIKVNSAVGDSVAEGQTLIVMEAMKMEYQLKAIASGKVKALPFQNGDSVNLGDTLAEIEVQVD